MTLGRRGREPVLRPSDRTETSQAVELEELPAERVVPRGPSRPGVGALLATGGLGLILVAGLGFLGGRQTPGRTNPTSVAPSSSPPGQIANPYVTPDLACATIRSDVVPGAILATAGRRITGGIEVVDWLGGLVPSAAPADGGQRTPPQPIDIRPDMFSVLYTAGDACALAWQIALVDSDGSIPLETVDNPNADPGYARQNRFELPLWEYRGHDYELEALLTFPNAVIRATWPVRLLPFEMPTPRLMAGTRSIAVAPGCDLRLSLGSGGSEPANPCDGSVASAPPVTSVKTGQILTFGFSDGWGINPFAAACGQLTGAEFVPEQDCEIPIQATDGSAAFEAADVAGMWTVGLAACATQQLSDTYNEVCGTWYATVRVQK